MGYSRSKKLLQSIFLANCILCFFNFVSCYSPTEPPHIFDFIVVGGGTGGCAVAGRLSESGQHTVLLLEGGNVPKEELEVPALVSQNTQPPWIKLYESVPQQNVGLDRNGVVSFMTGWGLGGSSSVNGMIWNRGSKYDFDNWANITKDESWSYSSLLPYFKKAENYAGNFPSDQHGYNGPITVGRPQYSPGLERWYQAGRELGYPIADPNGPQQISFGPVEFSKRRGRRVSSYTGYIKPFQSSGSNLKVLTNAVASQIVFEGERAVGVKYGANLTGIFNQIYVKARKEVILSAGVVETPVLLMKSGIGTKSVLEEAKIPQIKELPVGQGFQDHVLVFMDIIINVNNESEVFDPQRDLTTETLRIYDEEGDGPYSAFEGMFGQCFLRSSTRTSDKIKDWIDLHIMFQNTPSRGIFNNLPIALANPIPNLDSGTRMQQLVMLTRPKSRGRISLNPLNINGPPMIDFNMLSHPEDMEVMVEGIKRHLLIYENTTAYQGVRARYPSNPACIHLKFRSDEYWKCYIKQKSQPGIHAGGSCSMGSGAEDPDAVVDSSLRVIGVENLRVVDASIMPAVTNTNNQAAVFVIAEKASDMILKRWTTS